MDTAFLDLNIFNNQVHKPVVAPVTTSLTPEEVEQIRAMLQKNERHNVFVNKFDRNKPFRVAVMYDGKWNNYGNFHNIEVATCVAAIASTSFFGTSANTGAFNNTVVQSSQEWATWYENNKEVVVAAQARRNA